MKIIETSTLVAILMSNSLKLKKEMSPTQSKVKFIKIVTTAINLMSLSLSLYSIVFLNSALFMNV